MEPIFYYDGNFYKAKEAAVPLTDRSLFFGDAIYDACLVKNGHPYLLDAHPTRFYKGCGSLRIRPRMEKALRLILMPDRRYDFCHIKTVNLLPAVLASTRVQRADADEAVFADFLNA